MRNIMEEYIELTKKQISMYLKLIFENKYQKKIADSYTEEYVKARYYHFYEKEGKNLKQQILNHMKQTKENLKLDNIEERDLIENMCLFYYYVLYFDDVIHTKNKRGTVEKINKWRGKLLQKQDDNFIERFLQTWIENENQKQQWMDNFQSKEFSLKISPYLLEKQIYAVNLEYHFSFPMIYSDLAIKKVFETPITSEDKLAVEYSMVVVQIIQDMIKQNKQKHYILEFAPTLLKKSKKLKSLLTILENMMVQEKVSLKIRYEDFSNAKEEVYELIRNGYKIAIILDNSFIPEYANMEKLNIFSYILISKQLKFYEEIQKSSVVLEHVIEI